MRSCLPRDLGHPARDVRVAGNVHSFHFPPLFLSFTWRLPSFFGFGLHPPVKWQIHSQAPVLLTCSPPSHPIQSIPCVFTHLTISTFYFTHGRYPHLTSSKTYKQSHVTSPSCSMIGLRKLNAHGSRIRMAMDLALRSQVWVLECAKTSFRCSGSIRQSTNISRSWNRVGRRRESSTKVSNDS